LSSFIIQPGGSLTGTLRVPGDKSISHRSVILGSLAEGTTRVSGFLEGEDSLRTLRAFQDMGVSIEYTPSTALEGGSLEITGVGMHGLSAPSGPVDLGNSGTAMRLMAGVLAAQPFASSVVGDHSLHSRPMGRVIDPLGLMGAKISGDKEKRPPLNIVGGCKLKGIDYSTPVASAQIKSCLLLAGMYADGVTSIKEPGISRDHTERMLRGFGVEIESGDLNVLLRGGQQLVATDIEVPADISSAAFFLVGASIAPGSDLLLQQVGVNPTRTGIIDILRLMGADISVQNERQVAGEPVADLRVRYRKLKGIKIPPDLVPLAIDEFPALFVAAACAEGETLVTGAGELRVKETDRITAMVNGLAAMGVELEEHPDGALIQGAKAGDEAARLRGATVASCDDHRIAMSLAMAAMVSREQVTVTDCANVATSFPGFSDLARQAGLDIEESLGEVK